MVADISGGDGCFLFLVRERLGSLDTDSMFVVGKMLGLATDSPFVEEKMVGAVGVPAPLLLDAASGFAGNLNSNINDILIKIMLSNEPLLSKLFRHNMYSSLNIICTTWNS